MRCKLLRDVGCLESPEFPTGIKPKGHEVDHPDAWQLVMMGVAEPTDMECAERVRAAGMDPTKFEAAKLAYERVSRGIQPEDYGAYNAGYMTGYAPDGNGVGPDGDWIAGPKFSEWEAQQESDSESQ
jgi:hypothetical protein